MAALLPWTLFGQVSAQVARDDFWKIQERNNGKINISIPYSKIEGTPFLNSVFEKAQIYTLEKNLYGTFPLRYNVFTENFEFKKSNNEILELSSPGMVGKIQIDDTTFIYAPYMEKDVTSNGFFQVIASGGKAEGLIRYRVDFMKATPPGAYQDAQPPRFSSIQKDLFVRFGERPAVLIYKNSDFLKAVPDFKPQVTKFMKKERIHAAREKDLVRLINYYNSL